MENTPTSGTPSEESSHSDEPSAQSWQQYPPPGDGQPPYSQRSYDESSGSAVPPPPGQYPPPPGYPPYPGQAYQGYPPPGGPQGPSGPYGAYPPPASQGFSFQPMLQRWRAVLTQPGIATFDAQQQGANWQTILITLLILGAVEAAANFITALEPRAALGFMMPYSPTVAGRLNPIGSAISGLVAEFISFFVASGILYVSAKLFGGAGTFLMQSWLLSLFSVPLGIIAAIAGIIPVVGGLVAFAVAIYEIILTVLAIASAYRMPSGRATAVVLVPFAALSVLACALGIVAAGLLVIVARILGL